MVWVKICGITNEADARMCVNAGADALGFLIGHSSTNIKYISVEVAGKIISSISDEVTTVYVTKETDVSLIAEVVKKTGVGAVQLHGPSTVDDVILLRSVLPGITLYKVIHVEGEHSLHEVSLYDPFVDMIFLDTASQEGGGSGVTHDWRISKKIVSLASVPVVLAGGLTPFNVAQAMKEVSPFGVDVSSGVMHQDGTKDSYTVERFLHAAKTIDES